MLRGLYVSFLLIKKEQLLQQYMAKKAKRREPRTTTLFIYTSAQLLHYREKIRKFENRHAHRRTHAQCMRSRDQILSHNKRRVRCTLAHRKGGLMLILCRRARQHPAASSGLVRPWFLGPPCRRTPNRSGGASCRLGTHTAEHRVHP